ncbi:MAG: hypothetical protein NZM38_03760 [Cytophagales bacterium]|nr:hypothetical protein [Cytophagales bacterium]MDW8383869.1 hypothetical protein [Flammeovirgaceae bacterium]
MATDKDSTMFATFIRNIEQKISELTVLDIKTVVGDFNYTPDGKVEILKTGDFKLIQSRFNLIGGDVTTFISNELITDKYAWLRDFHARKEERGHEIVQGNIRAIIALYDLYRQTKGLKFNEENIDETLLEPQPLG